MAFNNKKYRITKEGYKRLKQQVKELEEQVKKIGIQKGEAAGPTGEWHDNAAYEEFVRQEFSLLQKLADLKNKLLSAEIVEFPQVSEVGIGNKVLIVFLNNNKEKIFTITDSEMSEPTKGLISYQSPIGAALMGKKQGEVVDGGRLGKIKILNIEI